MPEQGRDTFISNVDFDVWTAEAYFNEEYPNESEIEDLGTSSNSSNTRVIEVDDQTSLTSFDEVIVTTEFTSNSFRNHCFGLALAFVSGLIFTANNCVIQTFNLDYAENMLVRSTVQTIIFGLICIVKRNSIWPKCERKIQCLMIFQGVLGSVVMICAFSCMLLMPLGDALTLLFTEPFSTMFMAAMFLGHRLRLFKISLGLFLLIGVVLVIQPPFIFPNYEDAIQDYFVKAQFHTLFVLPRGTSRLEVSYRTKLYYIGVIIALSAALAKGVLNICVNKCSKIKSTVLMWWTGFGGIIVSLIAFTFDKDARMLSTEIFQVTYTEWLLLFGLAISGLIGYFCMTKSLQMIDPTCVAFVRSLEIIFGYIVQITILGQIPSILSLSGAIIVFIAVAAYSLQYRIMAVIPYHLRVVF